MTAAEIKLFLTQATPAQKDAMLNVLIDWLEAVNPKVLEKIAVFMQNAYDATSQPTQKGSK